MIEDPKVAEPTDDGYPEEFEMESIFGGDDRDVRTDRNVAFWKPFVGIYHRWSPNGPLKIGTGVLIAPRLILTAAHNVYNLRHNKKFHVAQASVGIVDGQSVAFSPIKTAMLPQGYLAASPDDNERYTFDYAVAVLENDAAYRWAGAHWDIASMSLVPNQVFENQALTVAGYPSKGQTGSINLHTATGRARNWTQSDRVFTYRLDTSKGQSGGPVFYTGSNGLPNLAGVHVAGFEGKFNLACRFNQTMKSNILKWSAALSPAMS